jgi:hypothetical protein
MKAPHTMSAPNTVTHRTRKTLDCMLPVCHPSATVEPFPGEGDGVEPCAFRVLLIGQAPAVRQDTYPRVLGQVLPIGPAKAGV